MNMSSSKHLYSAIIVNYFQNYINKIKKRNYYFFNFMFLITKKKTYVFSFSLLHILFILNIHVTNIFQKNIYQNFFKFKLSLNVCLYIFNIKLCFIFILFIFYVCCVYVLPSLKKNKQQLKNM